MNTNTDYFRQYYNEYGAKYYLGRQDGKFFFNEHIEAPAIKSLINCANISRHEKVLDIGCGFGYFARYLAEMGLEVTAIDISQKMIAIAKEYCKNFQNITYINSSFYEAALSDTKYKIILGSFMLSYFESLTDLFSTISKMVDINSIIIFSMLHPIVQAKVNKGADGYLISDYFARGYFDSNFLDEQEVLKLNRWSLPDVLFACKKASLFVEEIIEPKPVAGSNLDQDKFNFYNSCPSVMIFKIRKLIS